jgi:hypothetical protein
MTARGVGRGRAPLGGAPLGLLPLPPAPLATCEALCTPAPPPLPGGVAVCRSQVGPQPPRVGVALTPPCPQRTVPPARRRDEGRAPAPPALAHVVHQRAQPVPARLACRTARGPLGDPQPWMPAQLHQASEEPARPPPTVSQHQDRPVRWDGRTPSPQQAPPCSPPRSRLLGGQHGPDHWDGTATRDPTDGQDDKAVHHARCVKGQGPWGRDPQRHDPASQRHATRRDVHGLPLVSRCVRGRTTPCVQSLCNRGDLLAHQQGQKGGDGPPATRPGERHALAP